MIEANKYFLAKDPDIVITSKDLSTNEVFKVSDSTLCARPRSFSGGLKMIGVVKTSNFTFTYPFPILSTTSAQIFASQPSCLCSPFSTLRALLAVESQGKTLQSGHINFYLIK
jgi:hypothetical protein